MFIDIFPKIVPLTR